MLVSRLDTDPGLGDIVVFHPPAGAAQQAAICGSQRHGAGHDEACDRPTAQASSQTFIKRVVGLSGDRISIVDGHAIRNGVQAFVTYWPPDAAARTRRVRA